MIVALTVAFLLAVIVGVVYIFLIMPRVSDRADMDMLTCDYAHRGLHSKAYPENSLPAIALAMENGFGVELDVQMSSDGEIMVFHDQNLKRMCGVSSRIPLVKSAVLRRLPLGGTSYTVPTLEEVLSMVDGRVPILIEIKSDTKNDELCRRLADMLDTYIGVFAVASFNPQILAWFKRYRPRFARGQIVAKVPRVRGTKAPRLTARLLSGLLLNCLSRPDFIIINGGSMGSLSFKLCTLLFRCRGFVFTVRNQKQYRLCHSKGYYAVFEKFLPF